MAKSYNPFYCIRGSLLSLRTVCLNKNDAIHFKVLRHIFGFKSSYHHKVVNPSEQECSNVWMHQEVYRREYKCTLPSQRLFQQRLKYFGHVLRHPDPIEHKVCFNDVGEFRRIRHLNARGQDKLRRAPPCLHWAEQSMVQAYNRITHTHTSRPDISPEHLTANIPISTLLIEKVVINNWVPPLRRGITIPTLSDK